MIWELNLKKSKVEIKIDVKKKMKFSICFDTMTKLLKSQVRNPIDCFKSNYIPFFWLIKAMRFLFCVVKRTRCSEKGKQLFPKHNTLYVVWLKCENGICSSTCMFFFSLSIRGIHSNDFTYFIEHNIQTVLPNFKCIFIPSIQITL